jgi:hypothetical protein
VYIFTLFNTTQYTLKTKTLLPLFILITLFASLRYINANNISEFPAPADLKEEFEPSYVFKFQKVDDIIQEANKLFGNSTHSLEYYNYIASIIRKRFYHGYSRYSFSENALAYTGGLVWSHLSAVVIPDDILKYPMAACSQQAIVLMDVFKKRNIRYRKVAFTNHFTLEAYIDGSWRFFDPNGEPHIQENRESLEKLIADGRFEFAYLQKNKPYEIVADWKINYTYGSIDEYPAPRAKLFHQIGFWLQSNFYLIMSALTLFSVFLFVRKKDIY